jgi:hypothetical protein
MVKKVLGDRVVHSAATKEDTDEEVEISFKKMNDAEAVKFNTAWLLIDHNVNDMDPTAEEKSLSSGNGR